MGFRLRHSQARAIGDELPRIQSAFLKNGFEAARGSGGHEQPTTDLTLDFVDGQGAVDRVGRTGIEKRLGRDISRSGQGIEVIEDGFGTEILLRRMPEQARSVLRFWSMLDPFERLFDPPATVIQLGECGYRKGPP